MTRIFPFVSMMNVHRPTQLQTRRLKQSVICDLLIAIIVLAYVAWIVATKLSPTEHGPLRNWLVGALFWASAALLRNAWLPSFGAETAPARAKAQRLVNRNGRRFD
jgi:hypothetical protein